MKAFPPSVPYEEVAASIYRRNPVLAMSMLNASLASGTSDEFLLALTDIARAYGQSANLPDSGHLPASVWHENIDALLKLADALNLRMTFVPKDAPSDLSETVSASRKDRVA